MQIERGSVAVVKPEIPMHPTVTQWIDEDGECGIDFTQCICDKLNYSSGCMKCEKAITYYIEQLVKTRVALPTRKERAPNSMTTDMWVNENGTVGLIMAQNYAAIETSWWFKHLQKIPPMSWDLVVQSYECPYAFALMELEKWKTPKEVLWAPDLRLVLKFGNYYYLIAAASNLSLEEIKRRYGEGPKVTVNRHDEVIRNLNMASTRR